jgi:hypothetical protein
MQFPRNRLVKTGEDLVSQKPVLSEMMQGMYPLAEGM